MFRNSDEWMFGCQVINQSVENGSMPRAGDSPWTSLYSRSRRSYDRSVSLSRTCRRAPSLISAMARWICRLSVTMLLIRMTLSGRRSGLVADVGDLAGHHDVGVQPGNGTGAAGARLGMVGEKTPHHVVVEAEPADQLIGTGDLHQLRRAQLVDDAGHFLRNAKAVHRLGLVGADHVLREHQVAQVDFTHFFQQLLVRESDGTHFRTSSLWVL